MEWVCSVCGYVHADVEPPGQCPVCASPAKKFSEYFGDMDPSERGSGVQDGMDDFERDLFADYDDQ